MPTLPKSHLPLHPQGGEGRGEGGVQETAHRFPFAHAPLTQPSPLCRWRGLPMRENLSR